MKEATGELNMTVITVLIVAAVGAIIVFVIVPMVGGAMRNSTCETMFGPGATARRGGGDIWECCPPGAEAGDTRCQEMIDDRPPAGN